MGLEGGFNPGIYWNPPKMRKEFFGGDPTGIFELNDIKYQWAYNLWGGYVK